MIARDPDDGHLYIACDGPACKARVDGLGIEFTWNPPAIPIGAQVSYTRGVAHAAGWVGLAALRGPGIEPIRDYCPAHSEDAKKTLTPRPARKKGTPKP